MCAGAIFPKDAPAQSPGCAGSHGRGTLGGGLIGARRVCCGVARLAVARPTESETRDRGICVGTTVAGALGLVRARRHGRLGPTGARCAMLPRALASQLNRRPERGRHAGQLRWRARHSREQCMAPPDGAIHAWSQVAVAAAAAAAVAAGSAWQRSAAEG